MYISMIIVDFFMTRPLGAGRNKDFAFSEFFVFAFFVVSSFFKDLLKLL